MQADLQSLRNMIAFTVLVLLFSLVSPDSLTSSDCHHDINGNKTALISCSIRSASTPLMITWQKIAPQSPENVGTLSDQHGTLIQSKWQNIKANKSSDSKTTSLILLDPLHQAGCYLCLFNIFGVGKISGTACLDLYARPTILTNITATQNGTIYTCQSISLPKSVLTLNISHTHREKNLPKGMTSTTAIGITNNKTDVLCSVAWKNEVHNVVLTPPIDYYQQPSHARSHVPILIVAFMMLMITVTFWVWAKLQ